MPASRRSATRCSAASSWAARAERRMRSSRQAPGRPTRSRANQPPSLRLQRRRHRLARQHSSASQRRNRASAASSKAATARWSRMSQRCRRPRAARPVVAVERVRTRPRSGRQVPDHRRRDLGLLVGKAAVLAPVGELDRKPSLPAPVRSASSASPRAPASSARPARPPTTAAASSCLHPVPDGRAYGTGTADVTYLAKTHSFAVTGPTADERTRPSPKQTQMGEDASGAQGASKKRTVSQKKASADAKPFEGSQKSARTRSRRAPPA